MVSHRGFSPVVAHKEVFARSDVAEIDFLIANDVNLVALPVFTEHVFHLYSIDAIITLEVVVALTIHFEHLPVWAIIRLGSMHCALSLRPLCKCHCDGHESHQN